MKDINFDELRDNEKCVYLILHKYGELRTEEILSHRDEFSEYCRGCKSGTNIIIAGRKLERKGLVQKQITRGGLLWKLMV